MKKSVSSENVESWAYTCKGENRIMEVLGGGSRGWCLSGAQ